VRQVSIEMAWMPTRSPHDVWIAPFETRYLTELIAVGYGRSR
jgi:hypothetical protein